MGGGEGLVWAVRDGIWVGEYGVNMGDMRIRRYFEKVDLREVWVF